MLAVFSFNAKFCPNCGREIKVDENRLERRESFTCECGVIYQVADQQPIIDAATKSGGDLEDAARERLND